MLFLGTSTSPRHISTALELQQLFVLSHTHFNTALTLGRMVSHSFPPQVQLPNPRMPTLQITSPNHLLVWGTSSGAWSERPWRVCPRSAKRLWIDCWIAQSSYCYSHPNHKEKKKLFGVGMPPWILIIERFLGHTRFISGKQGLSSEFQHTVVQQYSSLQLSDI